MYVVCEAIKKDLQRYDDERLQDVRPKVKIQKPKFKSLSNSSQVFLLFGLTTR
jgi:hypothetical protein